MTMHLPYCKFLLLFIFLFPQLEAYTQVDRYADSLLFKIKYATEDDSKLDLIRLFVGDFNRTRPDTVISLIDHAFERLEVPTLDSANFYFCKSRAYYSLNDADKYRSFFQQMNDVLDRYNGVESPFFHNVKAKQNFQHGFIKLSDNLSREAASYFSKGLEFAKKGHKDISLQARLTMLLGLIYNNEGAYDEAQKYYMESQQLPLHEAIDAASLLGFLNIRLGYLNLDIQEPDSAKKYIDLIPSSFDKMDKPLLTAIYYNKVDQPLKALHILDSAIQVLEKPGSIEGHMYPHFKLEQARSQISLKHYQKAEKILLDTRLHTIETNDRYNQYTTASELYKYYRQRADFENALIYYEEYKEIQEESLYAEHETVLKGLRASYDLEIQEKENTLLRSEQKSNATLIQRQRWIMGLVGMMALVFGFSAYAYLKNARARRLLNEELVDKNEGLIERNHQIKGMADELRFVTDNFPGGIIRFDDNAQITFSNNHIIEFFEGKQDMIGSNVFEFLKLSSPIQEKLREDLNSVGKTSFTWSPPNFDKTYQVESVLSNTDQEAASYLMVFEDITAIRKQQEAQVQKIEESLENLRTDYRQTALDNEELNTTLENKHRELVTKIMQIAKRDSDLKTIHTDLKEIYGLSNSSTKLKLSKIIRRLNDALNIEEGWEVFNVYFQEMHPSFYRQLKERDSSLSNNDLRHCTFLKMGMNTQEVAQLLNVSKKSVEVARYRIKKKLNLSSEESLPDYISNIA